MASNPRINDLRSRLEREPGSRLFAQLAEELRKAGELDEAIRVARDGLAGHANYPSARMTLARALFDLGDRRAARTELEAVVASAPDNILAVRLLGEALEGLGLYDEAAARYRSVLALVPGDKAAQARLEALALQATMVPAPVASVLRGRSAQPAPPPPAPDDDEPLQFAPLDVEAPIPLASVEEEDFELERPSETTARLMALVAEPDEPLPDVAGSAPSPELEEPVGGESFGGGREELIFDFEAPQTEPTLPFGRVTSPPVFEEPSTAAPPSLPDDDDVLRPASLTADGDDERKLPVPELSSPTLAELYFTQGVPDQAAHVYRQILDREPWNERARRRLEEIEATLGGHVSRAPVGETAPADRRETLQRTIRRLEALLVAVRESRDQWRASPTL